jgi:lysophospholipase L1-like esterase
VGFWGGTSLRFLWLLPTAVFLVSSCGYRAQIRPLAPDAVILAFGDSITAGSGAGQGESYPAVLAGLIGRTVVNAGIPGDTTDGGLARLQSTLDEHRPALVILCLGGNDMLAHADQAGIVANLRAMIGMIKATGADVVLIGVPNPGILLSTAPFYEDLSREFGVPCECESVADILSSPGLKADQIHPNAAGYRRMAEAVAKTIQGSL